MLANSTAEAAVCKRQELKQEKKPHLPKLKGGNNHEHDPPEAEVQPISVGQTGVRLPLHQLQHRVHDYHGPPGRSIAPHSFRKNADKRAENRK